MSILIEFGKILIPASVVLYAAYLLTRTFIARDFNLKKLEIQGKNSQTILPIRLQAYERMALFLERMAPQNLLIRLSNPSHKANEFHGILLNEIQNEYNYNISQQVYMSDAIWALIKSSKEDLVEQINEAASTMKEGDIGIDLSKKIFQTLISKEKDPMAVALAELKKEIQQFF